MRGLDYSSARPGGAAIAAAGCSFVIRYIPTGAGLRDFTIEEKADLQANGLAIGLYLERNADRVLDGYDAGVEDATISVNALKALGFPVRFIVFFAVDFDTNPSHYSAIDAYFVGVDSVMGPAVGMYGESDIIDYAVETGIASYFVQSTAWSGGKLNAHRNAFQEYHEGGSYVNGGAVDFLETNGTDFDWLLFPEGESMTADEAKRLARVEALLAGNGIDTDDDGQVDKIGEDALSYAADHGFSAFYGIGLARKEAATAQQSAEAVATGLPEHQHIPGGVQR